MTRLPIRFALLPVVLAGCTSNAVRPVPSDAAYAGSHDAMGDAEDGDSNVAEAESGDVTAVDRHSSATDAESGDATTFACVGPDDCIGHIPGGPAVFCCVDKMCIYGQRAQADVCAQPDAQVIQASSYDQSCQADSDCVAVAIGNFCYPGADNCPSAAINKSAYPRYQADVAKTQASVCGAFVGCPESSGPCCRKGACQMNLACSSPADTLPACADAGGTCAPFVVQCGKGVGPSGSCVYPDEMCCLN